MKETRKMEGDYQVHGYTTCISRETGFQPFDIHRWLPAICGERAPARRAPSELHRQMSVGGIATPLTNGSIPGC